MNDPCDWDHQSRCYEDDCVNPATHKRSVAVMEETLGDDEPIIMVQMVCCHHAQED